MNLLRYFQETRKSYWENWSKKTLRWNTCGNWFFFMNSWFLFMTSWKIIMIYEQCCSRFHEFPQTREIKFHWIDSYLTSNVRSRHLGRDENRTCFSQLLIADALMTLWHDLRMALNVRSFWFGSRKSKSLLFDILRCFWRLTLWHNDLKNSLWS